MYKKLQKKKINKKGSFFFSSMMVRSSKKKYAKCGLCTGAQFSLSLTIDNFYFLLAHSFIRLGTKK